QAGQASMVVGALRCSAKERPDRRQILCSARALSKDVQLVAAGDYRMGRAEIRRCCASERAVYTDLGRQDTAGDAGVLGHACRGLDVERTALARLCGNPPTVSAQPQTLAKYLRE